MMTTFVKNFEKISEMQKQGLESMRNFTVFAMDAMEKVARHNYAVYGDMLEFAVSQAKLPMDTTEAKDLFERQVGSTKAFTQQLTERANEYVEIGKNLKDTSAKLFEKDIVEPAKKAAKAATQKSS